MKGNANNVTAGKPRVSGSVFVAATTATAPTTADSALGSAFTQLGFISEDGVKNNNSPESEDIKAWGGDTVLSVITARDDKFNFKLIEGLNPEVLKLVYGITKVTGNITTGLKVEASADELEDHMYVIDMIMKGNILKRIVIPSASLTELGEIEYADSSAVGYDVTVTAKPDTNGNTHYEYFKQGTVSPTST